MAQLTYETWHDEGLDFEVDSTFKGAVSALQWAYDEFASELVYACSFGIEGIVMIDLISSIKPDAQVVFLDTGLHFPETYALIEEVKKKYPALRISFRYPKLTVTEQAGQYGDKLWERQPNRCCHMRKVLPLQSVLNDAKAWLSGLRRDQSPTRAQTQFVNKDDTFHSIKICPLIHWTWQDIWHYVKERDLPYNSLHDLGYPSIGCQPCTEPGDMETGSRTGRWANQNKTECGLHVQITGGGA